MRGRVKLVLHPPPLLKADKIPQRTHCTGCTEYLVVSKAFEEEALRVRSNSPLLFIVESTSTLALYTSIALNTEGGHGGGIERLIRKTAETVRTTDRSVEESSPTNYCSLFS